MVFSGVHLQISTYCARFSLVANFPRFARNSFDISKGNLLESDRQFEYLLLRQRPRRDRLRSSFGY
jgi:hypothetical protein